MSDFILIEKNGERIAISPLVLENHLLLGWHVVEAGPVEASGEPEPEIVGTYDPVLKTHIPVSAELEPEPEEPAPKAKRAKAKK